MLDGRARLDVARLDPGELQLLTVAGLDADLLEQVGLQAVHASAQEKMTAVATRGQVLGTPPCPRYSSSTHQGGSRPERNSAC